MSIESIERSEFRERRRFLDSEIISSISFSKNFFDKINKSCFLESKIDNLSNLLKFSKIYEPLDTNILKNIENNVFY